MSINDALKLYMENAEGDGIGFSRYGTQERRIAALGNNSTLIAPSDIWPIVPSAFYNHKTSATTMEVFSTNANDTSAGTGARTIVVNGLDANYNEISEVVTLNGGTVAMVNTYIAINSAAVLTSGSGSGNAGDIHIRDSGAGLVRAIIDAIYGTARSSVYTVPAGFTLSVHSIFACVNRTAAGGQINYATIATGQRLQNGTIRLPLEFSISSSAPYRHDGTPGIITPEKTTFFLRCTANSATIDLTGAWLGKLRKNDVVAS